MNFFRRGTKPRPYAANSTGQQLPGTFRGDPVYEAEGEARAIFMDKLSRAIRDHLRDNHDKLQDSASFVVFSLFMVGKSRDRTKPIVMLVSDNKQVRIEAFRAIKDSGIMKDFPGFDLGHMGLNAEYENFRRLGSQANPTTVDPDSISFLAPNETVDVFAGEPSASGARRLAVYTQDGTTSCAVAEDVFSYRGRHFLHSAHHFLLPAQQAQSVHTLPRTTASDAGEDEDECEIMGLSDDEEEDEDELVAITSRGSASPVESGSEGDFDSLSASQTLDTALDTEGQDAHIPEFQSRLETPKTLTEAETPRTNTPWTKVGHVALSSALLDSAFVQIDTSLGGDMAKLRYGALPLESYHHYTETAPSDTAIEIRTPNGTIEGTLSGTPSFVRLPGSKIFQEVYIARLNRPLVPGDCGSWVKNAITGKIFGHVIAGSPKTGLVLLMPASRLFAAALGALSACDVGELICFKADVEAVSAEDVIPRPQPPSPYKYQPLANSSGEIRLIKIHRAQESQESGPNAVILLEISLFHTPLDQTSPYLAVSYIWGDPTPTHKLLVNGAPLWVSSSTFRALYTTHCSVQKTKTKLYQAGEDVALWIDALCINQLDIAERNVQVLQMGRIYRQARGVIGYIGAPPAGTGPEDGFLALARFGNAPVTKPPQGVPADQSDPRFQAWYRGYQIQKGSEPPEDFGVALTGLFLSNWFVRCWVIQEMALSRETVCLYGYGQEAKSWSLSTMAMLKAASDEDVIPRPPPSFLASGVDVTSDHSALSALKIWRSPTATPPRSGEGIYASPTHDEGEPSGQSKFDKHGKTGGRPSRGTRLSQDPAVQNCTNDVPKEDVDASLTAFLSRWILPTSPEDKERLIGWLSQLPPTPIGRSSVRTDICTPARFGDVRDFFDAWAYPTSPEEREKLLERWSTPPLPRRNASIFHSEYTPSRLRASELILPVDVSINPDGFCKLPNVLLSVEYQANYIFAETAAALGYRIIPVEARYYRNPRGGWFIPVGVAVFGVRFSEGTGLRAITEAPFFVSSLVLSESAVEGGVSVILGRPFIQSIFDTSDPFSVTIDSPDIDRTAVPYTLVIEDLDIDDATSAQKDIFTWPEAPTPTLGALPPHGEACSIAQADKNTKPGERPYRSAASA